jgi:hypothetical protein
MRAAAMVVLIVACGSAPEPEAPASLPTSGGVVVVDVDVQRNPQPAALAAHTLWNGRYECAQGVTGLSLTLDLEAGGRASAVFAFGAPPENPTVPAGRYLMTGHFDPSPDGRVTFLSLVPDRWLAQPPGYEMVGLTASIDASARTMQGRIDHPSCTVLALQRVQ